MLNPPSKIETRIFLNSSEASLKIAEEIARLIHHKNKLGEACVLGFVSGKSPIGVYEELVRMHREEGLSFKKVHAFLTDDYYPLHENCIQSHRVRMQEDLFNKVDIPASQIYSPDSTMLPGSVEKFCVEYEELIRRLGGIDLIMLGISNTGHIGINEPGTRIDSRTRIAPLNSALRAKLAGEFFGLENVPYKALTMGIGTILSAHRILVMAWGEEKAKMVQKTIEGPVSESCPSSFLQTHPSVTVFVDKAAAQELTREKTPWLIEECTWTDRLIRKAVVWLCREVDKPILKLTNRDYADHGMGNLIGLYESANLVNINVFNDLQHTISGWPGGKPNADDSTRPERALPYPKKVIIFSPHPDDDVISMGGTFARLVQQGHEVHVAYQTSGSIAVSDDDALSLLDSVNEYLSVYDDRDFEIRKIYRHCQEFLASKKPGDLDIQAIRTLKAAIRRGEARAACRYFGMPDERIHFLDLPFYETGMAKKAAPGPEDVAKVAELMQSIQPHQIYAAGDLSDPHGTHRICMEIITRAIHQLKNETWMKDCRMWLYRGAWQEWDVDQVDMAVPLSPDEVIIKRKSIYKHKSQNNGPLYPGTDSREFWQRAEDRNHATAELYDRLGMAEYQAIELFVRYQSTEDQE